MRETSDPNEWLECMAKMMFRGDAKSEHREWSGLTEEEKEDFRCKVMKGLFELLEFDVATPSGQVAFYPG